MVRTQDPGISARGGFTLIELIIVIVILGLAAALVVPGLLSSQRASNERRTSASLKTLTSAEADFRANDRDGNKVNDFWTGDVKGLYTLTPGDIRGPGTAPRDLPIRLIELAVAAADMDGAIVPAGGENMHLSNFEAPGPKSGYWFLAMEEDQYLQPDDPDRPYRTDTGGTLPMGKCHHRTRFGFIAVPVASWKGKYVYMVNENNSLFRRAVPESLWKSGAFPPGRDGVLEELRNWPADRLLKQYWSRAGC